MNCLRCLWGFPHIWHDSGVWNERADPRCQACFDGREHRIHDRKAWNAERSYG